MMKNKASLHSYLYRLLSAMFQTIKSDGSRHTMNCVICVINTGNKNFASGDYISPVLAT